MKIDENTIIKCNNLNEVKDCFNSLHELGFKTDFQDDKDFNFIAWSVSDVFCNFETVEVTKDINFIKYKLFLELYKKQIKKNKQLDLVVDKNGEVLKINNFNSDKKLFIYDTLNKKIWNTCGINSFDQEFWQENLIKLDYYISEEALKKAVKRKEIENKLNLLAFELNGSRDITEEEWEDGSVSKYFLCFDYYNMNILQYTNSSSKNQGTIFCISKNFLNKAIKLIGKKDLKDFLINN